MSEGLPVFTLSSRALGGGAALRAYQEVTAGGFTALPDGISPEDFRLDLHATHLGPLLISQVAASAQRFERSRRMIAATGTDHVYVVLYTVGGSTGTAEGRDYHVRTGDIALLDLSRPRETRSEDFRNVTLVAPRALIEGYGVDADALHGLVLKREHPLTAMLAAHVLALAEHAPRLSAAEGETMGSATAALIATLVAEHSGGRRAPAPPSPRRQILRYIDANLGDPGLDPARLMGEFGLSRAALYRMFDQDGGVADIIRSRRLAEAARLLGSAEGLSRRISAVAHGLGFSDISGFSRAFRARYGIAPSDVRNQSAAFLERARLSDRDADLAQWLRSLRR